MLGLTFLKRTRTEREDALRVLGTRGGPSLAIMTSMKKRSEAAQIGNHLTRAFCFQDARHGQSGSRHTTADIAVAASARKADPAWQLSVTDMRGGGRRTSVGPYSSGADSFPALGAHTPADPSWGWSESVDREHVRPP
jgi:hypothetical protein